MIWIFDHLNLRTRRQPKGVQHDAVRQTMYTARSPGGNRQGARRIFPVRPARLFCQAYAVQATLPLKGQVAGGQAWPAAKWLDKRSRVQLLVVVYQRQQYQQRVERQLQQWQRQQQQ